MFTNDKLENLKPVNVFVNIQSMNKVGKLRHFAMHVTLKMNLNGAIISLVSDRILVTMELVVEEVWFCQTNKEQW